MTALRDHPAADSDVALRFTQQQQTTLSAEISHLPVAAGLPWDHGHITRQEAETQLFSGRSLCQPICLVV